MQNDKQPEAKQEQQDQTLTVEELEIGWWEALSCKCEVDFGE